MRDAMKAEILNLVVMFAGALAAGLAHLGASRDPYQNFFTHLVFTWYDAHSPYEGEALLRLLRLCACFYFAFSAVCMAVLIMRLLRALEF
jgi:hypothetical protein